jgi:AcrR family transcriptional regulator
VSEPTATRAVGRGRVRATLPPLGPRRERSAADTRRRILDAAEVEFAAKGFDGARLAAIARGAGVQQALIHHYFDDKARLHRAVLERSLDAMTSGVWEIVDRMRRQLTKADIEDLAYALVDVMLHFYANHGVVLHIARHDSLRGESAAADVVADHLRPIFGAIAGRMEELQRTGELRSDFDPRQICMCAVAMASFPFQEERFFTSLWPTDCRSEAFLATQRRAIVEMVLGRIMP